MGNSQSSSPLGQCLTTAFAGNSHDLGFPSLPLYQFDYVKPYNLDILLTPAAVTRPTNVKQVSAVVQCAAASNVKVQAKSGGHSFANHGIGGQNGAVVVDLQHFKDFSIDTTSWQATIGAGATSGEIDDFLDKNGKRAMAHGSLPQIGIGGHATIGGLGPVSRQWGSALDQVQEVEVVLANGTIARASETQNADLLWGLKGAGASFGIITEFKVKTHAQIKDNVQYSFSWTPGSLKDTADIFKAWQKLIANPDLTRNFSTLAIASPLGLIIEGTFFGTRQEYDKLGIESKLPRAPDHKTIMLTDWLGSLENWAQDTANKLFGGIPAAFYAKSLAFRNDTLLTDKTIDDMFSYLSTSKKGSPLWFTLFDLEGGAINDPAPDATAYGQRDALFFMQSYVIGIPTVSKTSKSFLNNLNKLVEDSFPNTQLGAYAGYVDPDLANPQQRYWRSNYPRLQRLKAKYDAKDVFSNPQSVRPAPT